jgi:putative peptide zinc metalloprotease protein
MLQLRPTFSESWYRVKDIKVRLRPSAQISRQFYRGERWYVVRDPAGNQYHRLSDAAYRFVGLLDGTRTVGEAWDLVGGQLADDAPTQPEVIQILSQLHAANLIESNISPDAMVLLRRHKQQLKRKMQGRLMNVLFPRIPLWDPLRFIDRWMPVVRPFLSKFGALLWVVMIVAALAAVAPRWYDLQASARTAIDPNNWFWLWAVFVTTKLIHELGHAFACRRFGGEVHELGIMFLVLIPTPYVDASSAWAFPSRWSRMFVGAAGMIIELFVASILAFVWLTTDSTSTIHQLAYNGMLIASVSTVLFNANPLLRYDGYYMLSDFLETPNLQQKSRDYLLGLVKRHVFRVKATQPLPPPWQRVELAAYGVLSTVYRVLIGIAIILLVFYKLPEQLKVLGVLMGIGGVTTWLVVPIVKTVKYLALEPELHRKRAWATTFTLSVAAVILLLVGAIPVWVRITTDGIAEPEEIRTLYATTPGFVTQVLAEDGQWLQSGQVILQADNPQLLAEIGVQESELEAAHVQERQAGASDETQAEAAIYRESIASLTRELANLYQKRDELTVRAPISGRLIAPRIKDLPGRYLKPGTEIATVAVLDRLIVRAVLDQGQAELVPAGVTADNAQVRLAGSIHDVITGTSIKLPAASTQLPNPQDTHAGGGRYAADPRDRSGRRTYVPQFEVEVRFANPQGLYQPGQRAHVLLRPRREPLALQGLRSLLQLIQDSNRLRRLKSQEGA